MFAQERRDVILQVLHQDGTVLVKALSERFAVTEDCIRKDLAFLENQGFLKRTYGGAMELRSNPHKFHVSARKSEDIEGKQMIAKKAFAHLSRGDTVYLDISTSNLELMKEIVRNSLEVKVVTNMVDLIPLAASGGIQLFFTGGELNRTGDGFWGSGAIRFIERFRFDKGFFGAVGMDVDTGGAFTYDLEDGSVKSAAIRSCRRAFLVAEQEKFHKDGNYEFARLTQFEAVILDREPDREIGEKAQKAGVLLE